MLRRVVPGPSLQEEREELSAGDQDDISATQSKNLQNSYKIPLHVLQWCYIGPISML